jgi:putative zinc finger/helix-turn-helix YgiT family protein
MVSEYEHNHNFVSGLVLRHHSLCDHCGIDICNDAQSKLNKRELTRFVKSAEGRLSGIEIKALREKYNISQAQAAKIFGGGPVAFSKYENDDVTQADSMDKLMRVSLKFPPVFSWLAMEAKEDSIATSAMEALFRHMKASVKKQAPDIAHMRDRVVKSRESFYSSGEIHAANDDRCFGSLEAVG